MLSHLTATFGGHMHCDSKDIVFNFSSDFLRPQNQRVK